jgi:hypothetical protein
MNNDSNQRVNNDAPNSGVTSALGIDRRTWMDWKTLISNVLVAFAWPIVILIVVLIFRPDIALLIKRAKSFEIAGAKSEFIDYATAFGYMESQVTKLASEPNAEDRRILAEEIMKTSKELQGLHPLAFAFLAEIGRGVSGDSAWLEFGQHIIELKDRGYITLKPDASNPAEIRYKVDDFKNNTKATLTPKGDEFLARLGYTDRHTYHGNKYNAQQ